MLSPINRAALAQVNGPPAPNNPFSNISANAQEATSQPTTQSNVFGLPIPSLGGILNLPDDHTGITSLPFDAINGIGRYASDTAGNPQYQSYNLPFTDYSPPSIYSLAHLTDMPNDNALQGQGYGPDEVKNLTGAQTDTYYDQKIAAQQQAAQQQAAQQAQNQKTNHTFQKYLEPQVGAPGAPGSTLTPRQQALQNYQAILQGGGPQVYTAGDISQKQTQVIQEQAQQEAKAIYKPQIREIRGSIKQNELQGQQAVSDTRAWYDEAIQQTNKQGRIAGREIRQGIAEVGNVGVKGFGKSGRTVANAEANADARSLGNMSKRSAEFFSGMGAALGAEKVAQAVNTRNVFAEQSGALEKELAGVRTDKRKEISTSTKTATTDMVNQANQSSQDQYDTLKSNAKELLGLYPKADTGSTSTSASGATIPTPLATLYKNINPQLLNPTVLNSKSSAAQKRALMVQANQAIASVPPAQRPALHDQLISQIDSGQALAIAKTDADAAKKEAELSPAGTATALTDAQSMIMHGYKEGSGPTAEVKYYSPSQLVAYAQAHGLTKDQMLNSTDMTAAVWDAGVKTIRAKTAKPEVAPAPVPRGQLHLGTSAVTSGGPGA